MNEQLVVKNFGPIKDATVDFKRVTVFIGPTGGGKSTLAKLATVFKSRGFLSEHPKTRFKLLDTYSIKNFFLVNTALTWSNGNGTVNTGDDLVFAVPSTTLEATSNIIEKHLSKINPNVDEAEALLNIFRETIKVKRDEVSDKKLNSLVENLGESYPDTFQKLATFLQDAISENNVFEPVYIPSERIFLSSIEYSWAGLMSDKIGLPKSLLDFANRFSLSRKDVSELEIPFFNVKYIHRNGQDFIKVPGIDTLFRLYETASGIQSVTPLLVLLEQLILNTEQTKSFIIEEPELNLFPTAQFELVKILIDKCAQLEGRSDLVLTTHSPYVLTALNLLCYAFRIAQQDEATAKKVAKLIPRHCWIDPDQFAAYYVDLPSTKRKQQVRSIINKKTGLIEENELDTASDELSDIFDKLVRLRKPAKTTARVK